MLRYLTKNEKYKTKKLYKQAFFEDSKSFISYYYKHKIKDNKILVYEKNKHILSMAHLNPYKINFLNKIYEIYYIVAVATDNKFKRKGLMKKIIYKFLNDMYIKNKPFTFLLPANEAYYKPFGFIFVNYFNNIDLKAENISIRRYKNSDFYRLFRFYREYLSKNYDLYSFNTLNSFKRYLKELNSEKGYIKIYEKDNNIIGFEAFWGLNKKEKRESFIIKEFSQIQKNIKPAYMLRIVDLVEFLSNFSLEKSYTKDEFSLIFKIKDKIIKENNAIFVWTLSKKASKIEKFDESKILNNIDDFNNKNVSFEYEIDDFSKALLIDKKINNIDIKDIINNINNIYLNEMV